MLSIPINIDLRDVILEFGLKKADADKLVQNVVDSVTDHIYYLWVQEAKMSLNSTRNGYLNGLLRYGEGRFRNVIALTGAFNNMLESGASAFDMKPNFLNGKNVKTSAKGTRYVTIPFRHASAGALGENAAFSGVMPQEVYELAKMLQKSSTSPSHSGGGKSSGTRLSQGSVPAPYNQVKKRAGFSDIASKKTYDEYTHKSSIYAGMQRSGKTYEKANQAQYTTFRRISENSDPNSWINRGITAYNLAQRALGKAQVSIIAENQVDKFISRMF